MPSDQALLSVSTNVSTSARQFQSLKLSWEHRLESNRLYTIAIKAIKASGSSATSNIFRFAYDNSPPEVGTIKDIPIFEEDLSQNDKGQMGPFSITLDFSLSKTWTGFLGLPLSSESPGPTLQMLRATSASTLFVLELGLTRAISRSCLMWDSLIHTTMHRLGTKATAVTIEFSQH